MVQDFSLSNETANYYLVCLSSGWDPQMIRAFEADSCLLIKDSDRLHKRLSTACEKVFPGCISSLVPNHYFDPYDMTALEPSDPIFIKTFRFAY